jgi:hypothetical protein
MTNWISAGKRNYDELGMGLQRFGAMFFGIWVGGFLLRDYPNVGFVLSKFGALLAFGLFAIAYFRAKTPSQDSVELRTK